MSSQVKAQAIQMDVAPAVMPTITVSTSADPRRDVRLERFWETVHRLIFDERRSGVYKGTALRRYATALWRRGEAEWADYASRLAASYGEVETAIAHW